MRRFFIYQSSSPTNFGYLLPVHTPCRHYLLWRPFPVSFPTSSGRPKCRVVSSEDCQIRRVTHGSPVHAQFRRRGVAQTGPLNRLPFEVLCRSATCAQDNCQRTEIPPIRVTGAAYRRTFCAHSMLRQPLKVSILPLLLSVFDASTGIDERLRDASEAPRAVTDVGDGRQSRTNPDEVRTHARHNAPPNLAVRFSQTSLREPVIDGATDTSDVTVNIRPLMVTLSQGWLFYNRYEILPRRSVPITQVLAI